MTSKELISHGRTVFVEWITTIAVFISCFVYLSHKIDKQCERTDRLYEMFTSASKEQTERSDRLYEMFTSASKEQTERSDRLYEMFIDLLKERK